MVFTRHEGPCDEHREANMMQWSAKHVFAQVSNGDCPGRQLVADLSPVRRLRQQGVCVVDVAQIFKNHAGFNQQLENLKQQAEQFKYELQQRGEQLQAKSEQLKDFQIGSPEYKQLESELAQASANLEVERRSKTREFIQAEAELHFDTYVEVTRLIASLCEERGYRMALRFDSRQTDPSNADSIMQRVNEYVIFQNPRIDITAEIVSRLGGGAAPQVGSRPGTTQGR